MKRSMRGSNWDRPFLSMFLEADDHQRDFAELGEVEELEPKTAPDDQSSASFLDRKK